MNISILYPPGKAAETFLPISETTWHDLGFDLILPHITTDPGEQGIIRYIMMRLNTSPEAAQFRLEVFDDLYHHPKLRENIQTLLNRISLLEGRMSLKNTLDKSDSIWTLMSRLREIDEYIECVDTIYDNLANEKLTSRGLLDLGTYIRQIREDSAFESLRKDIRELRVMTSRVKSVTLGINLDENYETHDIGIISLNDKAFGKTGLLTNFTKRLSSRDRIQSGNEWNGSYTFEQVDTDSVETVSALEKASTLFTSAINPLMGVGLGMAAIRNNEQPRNTVGFIEQVMNQMMAESVKALKETLAKYVTVDIHSITNLIPEFLFYVRWADYIQRLQDKGYVFGPAACISREESLTMDTQGIYNMKLAASGNTPADQIIGNAMIFSPDQNLYLLTGANRGGKTTITQAVGQAFLMAQGGLYIPGSSFRFRPVDQIFTHFPADEDKTMDYGRLGEECSRFREIYEQATCDSLILLNESFSTTSFEEGYYIAYDAVRALLLKGSRTLFNTHMHKLARDVDQLNADGGDYRAASLIVLNEGSKRSYKLAIAPPEGTSYARDIAEKYGLTFEQLTQK